MEQLPNKPLCMYVLGGGPQGRPAGMELPSRSGMPPASSMGKPGAGRASAVLLLLLLCDPALLMEGVDMTKGRARTFILYFKKLHLGRALMRTVSPGCLTVGAVT